MLAAADVLPVARPRDATCAVVDEGLDDASIGTGWSDTAVTLYEGPSGTYGYVHGNCASCDESAGVCSFLGATDLSKSLSDLDGALAGARLDARVGARRGTTRTFSFRSTAPTLMDLGRM